MNRPPMRGALDASYEPIVPTIDDRLILRHIFARAYAEPEGRKTRAPRTPRTGATQGPSHAAVRPNAKLPVESFVSGRKRTPAVP